MHGIKVNELITGARAIAPVATAVIGIIATATAPVGAAADALDAAFPLNTPVLVTDVRTAIGTAGTGGTLKPALEAIADQSSPILVVVRVTAGEDEEATDEAVIGDVVDGSGTGLQALLGAEAAVGVRPRILGAPGLDTEAVTTEMIIVAKRLRGFVYARAIGDNAAEAVTYAGSFDARELMLIWPEFTGGFIGDAVARALGLRARIDEETGWHKTLSNVTLDGATGLTADVYFDLTDDTTTAGVLNAGKVTTMVRLGGGLRFWGNRTLSADAPFAFESAVRTAQALQDEIAAGLAWAVDKPTTPSLIKDILETINGRFRSLVAEGRIIGARAWYDPALNDQVDLAAGKVVIDYEFTPCAPAESITLNQRITDKFYAGFADQLATA